MSFDYDILIVGSGFGGSVSALRLAQKGYKIGIIEQGRNLSVEDFSAASNNPLKLAWLPKLGLKGFFAQEVFQHVAILRGIAVGGGSVLYGGVSLEPEDSFYRSPNIERLNLDLKKALEPHFIKARKMLGVSENPHRGIQDEWLEATAKSMDAHESFGPTPQSIYFASPEQADADPYFNGKGPMRSGCTQCGQCYSGCQYNAKNSLDKNYLFFAQEEGVDILSQNKVTHIEPLAPEGYRVQLCDPLSGKKKQSLCAKKVILAAGVLGTLELLFANRDRYKSLVEVSQVLGKHIRTNSEALVGIHSKDKSVDVTHGASISSHFYPDKNTHITQNRLPASYWPMKFYMLPLVDGAKPFRRAIKSLALTVVRPSHGVMTWFSKQWHKRTTYLTVMQNVDNEIRFSYGRTALRGFGYGLKSGFSQSGRTPSFLPQANKAARAFAQVSDGVAQNMVVESVGNMSVTAHILGGAVMGSSRENGVIDTSHQVFGHPGLFVMDGSIIPANPGVNPSLTITAMAERFAENFPSRL